MSEVNKGPASDEVRERIIHELPRWIRETPALRRELIELLKKPISRPKMSYEEFLSWADEDTLAEWVNGEVVMAGPASKRHQMICDFLMTVISLYVERHHLGIVLSAPFQMKLKNGREPDLIFVAESNLARLKETYLDGPADLAVEVVSPESAARDRGEKFYEYAQGGVPEYWIIDPQIPWGDFYRLEGSFYRPVFSSDRGVYRSGILPGFRLHVEWLFREPLPKTLDILRELEVI